QHTGKIGRDSLKNETAFHIGPVREQIGPAGIKTDSIPRGCRDRDSIIQRASDGRTDRVIEGGDEEIGHTRHRLDRVTQQGPGTQGRGGSGQTRVALEGHGTGGTGQTRVTLKPAGTDKPGLALKPGGTDKPGLALKSA